MRLPRKVVVCPWFDAGVHSEIAVWARAACAWHDAQQLRIARLGDNMRNVAVTEGDKVDAQIKLGFSVNGYGVGELVQRIAQVNDSEVGKLTAEYDETYEVAEKLRPNGCQRKALLEAARIELGLRHLLADTGANAFTDTFEDLHGLAQLPGIAVQRLMADGYGFAAEGDWKTAALVRAMKVMGQGLKGGTSFMEDYTYHLRNGGQVLGAHMLEICPSIAGDKPAAEIHPLSIGGKGDPVRLVFTASEGRAVNASVIDMGNRFRLLVNEVDVVSRHGDVLLVVGRSVACESPLDAAKLGDRIVGSCLLHRRVRRRLRAYRSRLDGAERSLDPDRVDQVDALHRVIDERHDVLPAGPGRHGDGGLGFEPGNRGERRTFTLGRHAGAAV